ncbi:uncharacterized protein DNG_10235 [Cephalotrichum gorgonifer]|uniref:Uncharacterized protein n=1 Tax=Cephalotrichum gorgonifer TaxID=2041049 RepID=A0AAE8N792_9PEZI|nr:uncharacterized protein DNG_10235 [Cephalotrichum gorgonifer]
MAAPPSVNILDVTGIWILQGVPWALRKILSFAGVSLHMTQTQSAPEDNPDGEKVVSIRVKQVVTPGGFSSEESYILDFQSRDSTVPIFGALSARSKYLPIDEIPDEEVRRRLEGGGANVVVQEFAHSKAGDWVTEGIWGFEDVNGERRFTRTNVTSKGDSRVVSRLVYDRKEE